MAWYRTGTITLANGSTAITGAGTDFISGAAVGEGLLAPDGRVYEIAAVVSATSLTLGTAYLGSNAGGQAYAILPSQSYIRDLAAQAAALVNQYQTVKDTVGSGKSVDGTVAQPSIRFVTDDNTGINHAVGVPDAMTLVAGGVVQATVGTTGLALANTPTAPTAAAATNTTQLATTAHVFAERTNTATLTNKTLVAPALGAATGASLALTGALTSTSGGSRLVNLAIGADTDCLLYESSTNALTVRHGGVGTEKYTTFAADGTLSIASGGVTATAPSSITANSTSAALTVTQTGAGNAFVVEGAASTDSTPFVINGGGQVSVGHTSQPYFISGVVPNFGVVGTGNTTASFGVSRYAADTSPSWLMLGKSRGAIGAEGVVVSGDLLGSALFTGSDGTQQLIAARIDAAVDGTPGTNDMPGRLIFSTTADGANIPTERMRIDSAGNVGIGIAPVTGTRLYSFIAGASTTVGEAAGLFQINPTAASGSTPKYALQGLNYLSAGYGGTGVAVGVLGQSTLNAVVTQPSAVGVRGAIDTPAAGTLTSAVAFDTAISNAGGASITNVYAFLANVTNAGTNAYGFYSNLAAGTNRWNFYAGGTADNYFAGSVGIGGVPATGYKLLNYGTWTGNPTFYGTSAQGVFQSDVTTQGVGYRSAPTTQATAFTLAQLDYFSAEGSAVGAGSTITTLAGFRSATSLIGATNNFGFIAGNTAAVTGGKIAYGFFSAVNTPTGGGTTWGFHASGTANNAYAGNSSFGKVTAPTSSVDARSFGTDLVTNAAGTYTVLATDHTIIQTTAGSTYTLPTASSFPGRRLHLVTQFAGAVISASSNVVPIAGGSAGTAILPATAGKFAMLQSNGTNWVIVASN